MSSTNIEDISNYITSRKYFEEGYKWYKNQYVYPIRHKIISTIIFIILLILVILAAINIYLLLPIKIQLKYAIYVNNLFSSAVSIKEVKGVPNDALKSVLQVLLEDYVTRRESYDYNNLSNQLTYVQNKSTRIVFRKFYNYVSLENYQSPVLRYQQIAKRKIKISSVTFVNSNTAILYFNSKAYGEKNDIFEDIDWKANITFESVDKIDIHVPNNSDFNFFVTDYQITLLKDNNDQNK